MTLKEDIPAGVPNIILINNNTKTKYIHTTSNSSGGNYTSPSSSLCNKDKFKKLLYTCARANYYFNIFISLSQLSTIMASSSSLSVSPSGFQLLALGLDMDPYMRCCQSNNLNPTPNSQKKNRKKKNKRKNKQNNSKPQQKQVHFDEENMVVVIEFVDDEESVALRKCYWEFFATDRSRFKDRISQTNEAIEHCFAPEHREKIYRERFQKTQEDSPVPVQEKGLNDAE